MEDGVAQFVSTLYLNMKIDEISNLIEVDQRQLLKLAFVYGERDLDG